MRIASLTGIGISEIETPALLIDLNAMERNIAKMAEYFRGVKSDLRPHIKTHKCPVLAHKQMDAGAIGICCQKLGEAEVMVASGLKEILITNEIVDPEKIGRLVNLQKHSHVIVAMDNLKVAEATSEEALMRKVTQDVVIDIDVGINRCGVEPGKEALRFAKEIVKKKGLRLRGLLGYESPFFNIPKYEKRKEAVHDRIRLMIETRDILSDAGIEVDTLSAGATGTYNITGEYPGVTEVEAGSYIFMDANYRRMEKIDFEQALTLLTTVISRPKHDRAILNAGVKAITREFGLPQIKDLDGADVTLLSEEHAKVKLSGEAKKLGVGDKVELTPTHCCTTVNQHDFYYGVRDGILEVVWEISARGQYY